MMANPESTLSVGLRNPDFPKYQSGKSYSSDSVVPYGSNPPASTSKEYPDITALGSLKDTLHSNLKLLGASNILNSESNINNE